MSKQEKLDLDYKLLSDFLEHEKRYYKNITDGRSTSYISNPKLIQGLIAEIEGIIEMKQILGYNNQ